MSEGLTPSTDEITHLAQQLIGWYSWQVVQVEPLVRQVQTWLVAGGQLDGSYALERFCERGASEQLYAALERGPLRTASSFEKESWQQAYQDVHHYLLAAAPRMHYRLAPDVTWESLVHDTLIAIHGGIQALEEPGALLAWAMGILNNKRRERWREWRIRTAHTVLSGPGDDSSLGEQSLSRANPAVLDHRDRHVDPEGDQQFYTIIRECLRNDQERIIALSLSFGLKRREILLAFESLVGRFDNIRRALLARLRECARVAALFDPQPGQPTQCLAVGCPVPALARRRP